MVEADPLATRVRLCYSDSCVMRGDEGRGCETPGRTPFSRCFSGTGRQVGLGVEIGS